MTTSVISARLPPDIDLTKATLAYGNRALPRLNRELNDATLLTRQKSVRMLCDYLHDPQNIAGALREGITVSLKKLLADSDITVRQKSTECLYVIAGHAIGREAFLREGIIVPLSKLFDDSEDIARLNAHLAFEMLSKSPTGAEGIVEAKLVPTLVKKLKIEHDEIKELILDTLHFCMFEETQSALDSEAMEVFTELLQHKSSSIRGKAARDIMDLSVPLNGKNRAVEVKCVPVLVDLLKDTCTDVRANAAGALMMITITTKGKYTALASDAIAPLVSLVDDPTSEVRVNAVKALTCLSEAPEGRKALSDHVEKIKARTEEEVPAVVKAANCAASVITWKP
ncbi:hypothetical protein CAPTEDRAFT_198826 [Capitella teleta]|uniref:Condensin complex subunit 1 C-terminal domain-containing protein n=1 Tax=Capitella teleta TaxID=283909 RepID=R7T3R5_CAPTE|nr:hypothetical protein CAPTEDRAFT_198826 [Capitella teleta]|eukprot:ELT87452.1 hypothetical protein CAPTEDRAFT_198826 [Capitella teleta]